MTTISIITSTLNAGNYIGRLAGDLLAQTDTEFEWIIVDGGSTDNTLDQFPGGLLDRILVIQEPDFGIYDALNKGIRQSESEYYLVMGADDRLNPDAVANYRSEAQNSNADIVSLSIVCDNRIMKPGRGHSWLYGMGGYVSGHAVGALIRKSLHDRYGYYSNLYPVVADQYFIKKCINGGATLCFAPMLVAGEYSLAGFSNRNVAAFLFEFASVQLKTERNKALQLIILFVRLIRNWRKI